MKKQITTSIVLTALACAAPVAAQDAPEVQAPAAQAAMPAIEAPSQTGKPVNLADMRHHIYVMEGALARAVDYGAKQLNREISTAMPGPRKRTKPARASASSSRTRNPGGPLATELKKLCHRLMSTARDRADSTSARRPTSA